MVSDEAHAALQEENGRLRAENREQRERNAALTIQLADAVQRIGALEGQIAQQQQRIAQLEAKKTPPPPFVKANAPARPPRERKKRAAEHNRGRRREEPTRVEEHRIAVCPDCGDRLGGLRVGRTRQVVDLPPPPPVEVVEHQVWRGWCSRCHRWREAPLGLCGQGLGHGRLSVGIASLVARLRTGLRLPFRVIQRYLAELHGLRVSVGELVELLHRVGERIGPEVAAIQGRIRARAVVHADETGWRENGRNGYVWTLATAEGERLFVYDHSRAGAVVNALLGEAFAGVLVSDFYGGYNDTPGGRHQRCWVHLLRDVHELAVAFAHAADLVGLEVRAWTGAVQALWRRVRAAATSPPERLDPDRRRWVATCLQAALEALGAQFVARRDHPCRPLAWRLWHFQDELLTCVRHPEVPPDNNAAERAIRPQVIARKISGGTRSPRGSQTRMRLASLAATASASGLNPLAEFRRLLHSPLPQI